MHIWGGHDYLPYEYDGWMLDSDSHTIGLEIDGVLASLCNIRVIENGMTGWMEGIRVHPDFQGKGLSSILTDELVKMAESLKVERIRLTTSVQNPASMKLAERAGMSELYRRIVFWFHDISEYPIESKTELKRTTAETIWRITQKLSGINPTNTLDFDWKTVDATLQSLKTLGNQKELWIQENNESDSFSIASVRPDSAREQWCFTIYSSTEHGCRTHLNHHLQRAKELGYLSVFCTMETRHEDVFNSYEFREDRMRTFKIALFERVLD